MPGPKPKYQPELRPEDLEEAGKVLRRRKSSQGEARRARLALLLEEKPNVRHPEAARLLGVHPTTVRYWRKRWAEEGFQLQDKPRSGRPAFFPSAHRHDGQEHCV